MPFRVRPMRLDDTDQVTAIDREAFPAQWPPADYRHELRNQLAHYIIAHDDERQAENGAEKGGLLARMRDWLEGNHDGPKSPPDYIVGFSGIWLMADEAHVTSIAVRKGYQGRGVGELLMIGTLELAEQLRAGMVTLEVRLSNYTAQSLYLKYGLKNTGLRRAYYTDNREDAIIMSTDRMDSPAYREHLTQLREAYFRRHAVAALSGRCSPGS